MKKSLLITLGHNSSAIFVDEDKSIIVGYEQERLDGIKSSSRFPADAINEIIKNVGYKTVRGCTTYISHWFDSNMQIYGNKYMSSIDYDNLCDLSSEIITVNKSFTHHDAHAYSAIAFFEHYQNSFHKQMLSNESVHVIVADGFGTDKEVLSIYEKYGFEKKLIHRTIGYDRSLGLMYQYATSFCGMKENQDEYKFLGYEPMISGIFSNDEPLIIDGEIASNVESLFHRHFSLVYKYDPSSNENLIDFDDLKNIKQYWHNIFASVLKAIGLNKKDATTIKGRVVISYFIQQSIELLMQKIITKFNMTNIVVCGGLFYNVKLNNSILTSIKGTFCAMPLAGDQGAAIGMMEKDEKVFNFDSLSLGIRNLEGIQKMTSGIENMFVFDSKDKSMAEDFIVTLLSEDAIVNLIDGNMEFGPRALCNTSTLFLPTAENVAANNAMNNRNEVMPCAPVMKHENANMFFDNDELNRVVGSDRFMICTHDYKLPETKNQLLGKTITDMFYDIYGGVAHKKTNEQGTFTGRPQLVFEGSTVWNILDKLEQIEDITNNKCLVNTSFNAHGRPIVFDIMDIIHNYKYQRAHAAGDKKPYLIVII